VVFVAWRFYRKSHSYPAPDQQSKRQKKQPQRNGLTEKFHKLFPPFSIGELVKNRRAERTIQNQGERYGGDREIEKLIDHPATLPHVAPSIKTDSGEG
jgi:hypothetical protein